MKTSPQGRAALEFEEGVVLRSYRDVKGVWTIYVGLTSAAGIGKIGPNMVITRAQGDKMLDAALSRNYEPAVTQQMPGAKQNEFDAGVLFNFNTGAIARASWVTLWRAGAARALIANKFRLWVNAGGKPVVGLKVRRERELRILFDGVYPEAAKVRGSVTIARWVLPLEASEMSKAMRQFRSLGYAVGADAEAIPAAEIRRFQRDHGLSVDAKIGKATLATLQRRIDAQAEAKAATTAGAAGTASAVPASDNQSITELVTGIPHAGLIVAAIAAGIVIWIAWRRRDAIAAKINARAPRLAAFLRSF